MSSDARTSDADHFTASPVDELMPPDELAEARRYGRERLRCRLLDTALDLAYLAIVAIFVARPLDAWLATGLAHDTARLAALVVIVSLLHAVIMLPLAWYSGYVLEHRHKLSHETPGRWAWRGTKRLALGLAFELVLFVGLYWLIWLTGGWWWLAAAFAFFLVSVVLGQLAPVLLLPLFYKVEPLADPALKERLEGLARAGGHSLKGVFRIRLSDETVKANAMLAGLGRTRRVLLGDTLLDRFTPDEIEVVFAHEVGHHVHRHIPKMIAAGAAASTLGFWICDRLLAAWMAGQGAVYDPTELPVHTLPFLMLAFTGLSTLIEPLANIVSRHYERQCDRYALKHTGKTAAFLSAFRKLARLNKADPAPPPLEVFLFHSHPPIAERLAMAHGAG
jgi:STE24 endopeptidase